MLTYATFGDYLRVKGISPGRISKAENRSVRDYLNRATRTVDSTTRRGFFPYEETRRFSIPSNYVDLRQRAFVRDDLYLDRDLLEVQRVQVGVNNAVVEMYETLPAGGLTALQTTFTANNVDGLDSQGGRRISVGDVLRIESEDCPVIAVDTVTNVVQIQRGAFDTLAVAHAAGVDVQKLNLLTLIPGIDFYLLDFNIRPAFAIRIVWPATWAGRFTGASWRYRYPQIYVTGNWGYHERPKDWWVDTLETVPTGGWTASTSSWTPADINGEDSIGEPRFEDGYLYRVDDELIWGGAVKQTVSMLRGKQGSAALPHAEGTPIYRFAVLHEIVEATIDIARTLRESDESVGGRQGVSDMSVGVQIGYSRDTSATLKRMTRAIL